MSISHNAEDASGRASTPSGAASSSLAWLSLLVAVAALVGSLWLSVGMGLKACPLCLYQRTFVMGVVGVLGVGVVAGKRFRAMLPLLALPLAIAGLGVAAFHEYLELTGKLECPDGVLGIGTAPRQSLAVLILLLALVSVGSLRGVSNGDHHWLTTVWAMVLGVLFAVGAIASAPPMPAAPTKAYEAPLEICRPPFRP